MQPCAKMKSERQKTEISEAENTPQKSGDQSASAKLGVPSRSSEAIQWRIDLIRKTSIFDTSRLTAAIKENSENTLSEVEKSTWAKIATSENFRLDEFDKAWRKLGSR